MKIQILKHFVVYGCLMCLAVSCTKEQAPQPPGLPDGTTAFTAEETAFVPYSDGSYLFKKSPDFLEELTLSFTERRSEQAVFAWDQTFLIYDSAPDLKAEFRLRYLKSDEISRKTLAIYLPYKDATNKLRNRLFETPINREELETGFFQEKVIFHETLDLGGQIWTNVFEIKPLVETPENEEVSENYTTIFYTEENGLVGMDQTNGSRWVLQP